MPSRCEDLANAIETVRAALNLTPYHAYGPADPNYTTQNAFQTMLSAIDRFSGEYTEEDCNDAISWCKNYHGMLDW